ncbi:MAG: hypothetical protein SNJ29_16560 [Rikenellaceae bacterium]
MVIPLDNCDGSSSINAAQAEAVAMRLARAALILTVPSSLARADDGGVVYAKKLDANLETFDHLVSTLDGCEFDNSAEMIAELVEDFSTISRLDIVNFFEQLLFLWIMDCQAVSLRSFALYRPNDGLCTLSPLVGVSPAFAERGEVSASRFPITINNKSSKICRSDFESAMRYMGLKDRIIRITIEKMICSKERWLDIISTAPISIELKALFVEQITTRINILLKKRG